MLTPAERPILVLNVSRPSNGKQIYTLIGSELTFTTDVCTVCACIVSRVDRTRLKGQRGICTGLDGSFGRLGGMSIWRTLLDTHDCYERLGISK